MNSLQVTVWPSSLGICAFSDGTAVCSGQGSVRDASAPHESLVWQEQKPEHVVHFLGIRMCPHLSQDTGVLHAIRFAWLPLLAQVLEHA